MADLDAEKFVDDAIPGTGCSGFKYLDFPAVDRVDCINLTRAAMKHALDELILRCKAMSDAHGISLCVVMAKQMKEAIK